LPSSIYNSKTVGVFYDFLVVGAIDDEDVVEKRRKRGGVSYRFVSTYDYS